VPGIFAGMTLPINAVLWAGVKDGSLYEYNWQRDENGNWNGADATTACRAVTADACKKLKDDCADKGMDLRVYIVKYRKQTQYKNKITGASNDFDYGYLSDCATENNSTYVKDVADEAGLNTALQEIADNTGLGEWRRKMWSEKNYCFGIMRKFSILHDKA
jgi:hypothetical protein